MKRDIASLSRNPFDLAVIGCGIHGATIAALAARAGLSVALLEKADFCAGTSANSLKIIHGGLRYLQHLDLPRIRESVKSRRWMLANFPDLVHPLPCIMPTRGSGARSRLAMGVALAANEVLSADRNCSVPKFNHIPRGRLLSKEQCMDIVPAIEQTQVTGAALWYDALVVNSERPVFDLLHLLNANGGHCANYVTVEAVESGQENNQLHCLNQKTGEAFTVNATWVVNATGPNFAQFAGEKSNIPEKGMSRAVNLIADRIFFGQYAVGLEGKSSFVDKDAFIQKGSRLFFFVPWQGKTMIGTTYTPHPDLEQAPEVSNEELYAIVEEINQIYPAAALTLNDITSYHQGLVPSEQASGGGSFDAKLDKKEEFYDHEAQEGLERVMTVKTVKYTTAYTVALAILTQLAEKGGALAADWKKRAAHPFPQDQRPLAGHDALKRRYGRSAKAVLTRLDDSAISFQISSIAPDEIAYAVEEEMALHLDDLLLRRTNCAAAGGIDAKVLASTAKIMGQYLGWSKEQLDKELERFHLKTAALLRDAE